VWLALECDSLIGLSITEMEIRAAVRLATVGSMSGSSSRWKRTKKRLSSLTFAFSLGRCYFFERDSDSELASVEKKHEDSDTDKQQLKDLKVWIKAQGFVLQSYQSANLLSDMVANEIGKRNGILEENCSFFEIFTFSDHFVLSSSLGGVLRLDLADRVRQRETQTNSTPSNPTTYDPQVRDIEMFSRKAL
jgi:hypothetical protein